MRLSLEVHQENPTPYFRALALLDETHGDIREARKLAGEEMLVSIAAKQFDEYEYWRQVRECLDNIELNQRRV